MNMYISKPKGKSFLTHLSLTIAFVGVVLLSMGAHAMGTNTIQFRGQIIEGPFKDQRVSGVCVRDPNGNLYKQNTRCVMFAHSYPA